MCSLKTKSMLDCFSRSYITMQILSRVVPPFANYQVQWPYKISISFCKKLYMNSSFVTTPCNICWLCKAMIGYYKIYKVNTHKEDERMEDSVKYRMQNDLHMKTKEAQGCCLLPSNSYHHTTSLILFMLLPNK